MDSEDEAEIRRQRELWKAAFEAGDVDRIMSFYAPADQIVAFDIMPPLEFDGWDDYRSNWVDFLGQFDGAPSIETRDMAIACSGDVAFVRCLTRLGGVMQGKPVDIWTRETNGMRKIEGTWLVVHDHVSVPVDFSTGQPCMALKP